MKTIKKDEELDFREINLEKLGMFVDSQDTELVDDTEAVRDMRHLLDDCEILWNNLEGFRRRRRRNRDFVRGDQWSDEVADPDNEGSMVTEKELILRQGRIPMINNQMRQLSKNLIGQYRENDYKPVAYPTKRENASQSDMMTNALQAVLRDNESKEVDARMLEEFLISGYIGWKNYVDWVASKDLNDVVMDPTNPTRMFWNSDVSDIRGKDIRLIGELHDMTIDELIRIFAKSDEDEEIIRGWYNGYGDPSRHADYYGFLGSERVDGLDFYWCHDSQKVRMYEIWQQQLVDKLFIHDMATGEYYETDLTMEEIDELNEQRVKVATSQGVRPELVPMMEAEQRKEMAWFYYYLTPQGYILAHGESPYEHQEHPYTIGLFPLVDGEIWGFFEDILDQQKQINRLITLLDFMMGAAAKGVLMVPEDSIPDGWNEQDFADEFVKFNGVIVYKPSNKHNHIPKQITANTHSPGATELLSLQMNLLKEISGVNDAIQGIRPPSGTPASLYAQQTNNAAITNKDFFEFFYSIRKKRDFKIVQLIQQYYDEMRWINVSGNDFSEEARIYDPEKARDARFDIVLGIGNNNPVYRQVQDEWLFKFWEAGGIDLRMFLENSAMPFSEKLLSALKGREQELANSGESPHKLMIQAMGQQIGNPQGIAQGNAQDDLNPTGL